MPRFFQVSLQVAGVPEECMVNIFTVNGHDQPFDERTRQRYVRNGFDLGDSQNAKIRLPAPIPEQRALSELR
jgi:hypothetical protein